MLLRNYFYLLASFLVTATALMADEKTVNVNIRTNQGGWPAIYWVIGALVLAVIIAVVAMATRSSSRT